MITTTMNDAQPKGDSKPNDKIIVWFIFSSEHIYFYVPMNYVYYRIDIK